MSEHHDDHALPPPEEDVINAASLTFWGVASFISVLVTIFVISSYFWLEVVSEEHTKTSVSPYKELRVAQSTAVQNKLSNVKELWQVSKKGRAVAVYNDKALADTAVKAGKGDKAEQLEKVQIPIERAMQIVMAERAKSFKKPAPPAPAPAPVLDPNAPAAPAPAP